MTDEYTPTTEEVRFAYVDRKGFEAQINRGLADDVEVAVEFDRWLEAHDREVAAKALRDVATKRWVCGVQRSGYHNGATCRPDDPHEYWGCEYRYEFSVPASEWEVQA